MYIDFDRRGMECRTLVQFSPFDLPGTATRKQIA
jgi:hypothetical protein